MTQVWNISNGFTSPFLLWQNNNPPKITTTDRTIATTNATYYFDYRAEDSDPSDILPGWSLVTNADWLNLDDNYTLSGIPNETDLGPYFVNISIDDGRSGIDWHNFTLKINTSNNAPFILTQNDIFADEDFLYSNQYLCKRDEGDDLEWSVYTNASFLEISGDNGLLHGTPLVEDIGQYFVNVSVHDGQGAVEWTEFNLIVNETNDDPIILTKNIEFSWETFWYGNLYEAYDEENDELTWTLTTNASWLDINRTSGFLKGYPDQGDNGNYFVNITLGDIRGGSSWTNFTLTIYSTIGSGNQTDPVRIWNTTHFRMIELDLDRNYKMINDINASVTRNLNGGKGIVPIGGRFSPFTNSTKNFFKGSLDGDGYNITNLWINRPNEDYIGLFSFMSFGSTVKDLSILNATIYGAERTGAVSSGLYGGQAFEVHVTGTISGRDYTGGLFGYAADGCCIRKSSFNGDVSGWSNVGGITGYCSGEICDTTFHSKIKGNSKLGGLIGAQIGNRINNCSGYANIAGGDELGGLIGCDQEGNVDNCHVTGMVQGSKKVGGLIGIISGFYHQGYPIGHIFTSSSNVTVKGTDNVGGLAGKCSGKVMDSFSIGDVQGNNYCGGLIGYTNDRVHTSYSNVNVSGTNDYIGGLIGKTINDVVKCYSNSTVNGQDYIGGLCGWSTSLVELSFSRGNVSGAWQVGGMIGFSEGNIENCYSTSKVIGNRRVGGLIGRSLSDKIEHCYSMGEVKGDGDVGGLVGLGWTNSNKNSFWDKQSSGVNSRSVGTGLPTLEMIDSSTYTNAGWNLEYVWNIAHNMSYPFLRWKSFN
ncbi:MAG TPA: hypothetical protein ENK47_02620, partial [Euryarchaeota archaeon]|nr:hypothetical protein [Euryarchaeota archaeon]